MQLETIRLENKDQLYLLWIWCYLELLHFSRWRVLLSRNACPFRKNGPRKFCERNTKRHPFRRCAKLPIGSRNISRPDRCLSRSWENIILPALCQSLENLLSQYQLYMDNENYLKEAPASFIFSSSVPDVFPYHSHFGDIPLCWDHLARSRYI